MKQNAKTILKVLLTVAIVIGSVAAALTAFILTIFVWGTPWLILTIAGFVIVPSMQLPSLKICYNIGIT